MYIYIYMYMYNCVYIYIYIYTYISAAWRPPNAPVRGFGEYYGFKICPHTLLRAPAEGVPKNSNENPLRPVNTAGVREKGDPKPFFTSLKSDSQTGILLPVAAGAAPSSRSAAICFGERHIFAMHYIYIYIYCVHWL